MTMPTNGKSKFTIRMDDEPKAQFTAAAYNAGTTAAELVRQMIAWWMREPGVELPPRPKADRVSTETVAEQITGITSIRNGGLDPLHEPYNNDKTQQLIDAMMAHGWQGPPVVASGEQALTGSHRIAAASRLWNADGVEVDIPRVEIADLCELYGVDWDAVCAEHGYHLYDSAAALRYKLPREVVDYLGFDVDGAM